MRSSQVSPITKAGYLFNIGALLLILAVLVPTDVNAEGMMLRGNVSTAVTSAADEQRDAGKGIVGLDLAIRPNRYPIVRDVFRYSPAHFSGIRPGDTVMAVNGESTLGRSSEDVDYSISDVPGETVILTIQRGQQVRNLEVTVTSLANAHPELKRYFISYNR